MRWLQAASRRHPLGLRATFLGVFTSLLVAPYVARIDCSTTITPTSSAESSNGDRTATAPMESPLWHREQILKRLGVERWHKSGNTGRGIKIAILDSGFRDYRSFLGKALPAQVTAKSFRYDGNLEARDSQHGILCGEVIHALAPEAELLLANWESDKPATFLEAAKWAKEQGAKVLSCSLIMPSWSDGEGGGVINAALSRILGSGQNDEDILMFASAGNVAQRHWCGPIQRDAAGFHQWTAGHRNNTIVPWGNERVSVELYGPECADLELQVYDSATGRTVGRHSASVTGSICGCPCAIVRFRPEGGARYYVRVRCPREIKDTARFHLVVLGGGLNYTTNLGSIPCPADCPAACAVGAVDTEGNRMVYSSCGPNSALPKPDFVAEVPFPSMYRDRPFAGTSAAAPQAAAMAALVWAGHPMWNRYQVNEALKRWSRDLGPMGHDCETGHGLLHLP